MNAETAAFIARTVDHAVHEVSLHTNNPNEFLTAANLLALCIFKFVVLQTRSLDDAESAEMAFRQRIAPAEVGASVH